MITRGLQKLRKFFFVSSSAKEGSCFSIPKNAIQKAITYLETTLKIGLGCPNFYSSVMSYSGVNLHGK